MEVHHPHHPPKSFKDYINEFIVIFIALTLGFIVENQREHYIEGLREKELAQALLRDLMADSVDFNSFIKQRTIERKSINTAIEIMDKRGLSANDSTLYYHFINGVFVWRHPEFRNANLDQIISSGSLRYFKNDSLIQSISELKMEYKKVEFRQEREKEYFYANIQPWVASHLELSYMDQHRKGISRTKTLEILSKNPGYLSDKPFFNNLKDPNLAINTANILRGQDFLYSVTENNFYASYQKKVGEVMRQIRKKFPQKN
jgi:hypothetical protein